jgi:hypothetical protein
MGKVQSSKFKIQGNSKFRTQSRGGVLHEKEPNVFVGPHRVFQATIHKTLSKKA